jgi:hypothetical protein
MSAYFLFYVGIITETVGGFVTGESFFFTSASGESQICIGLV